MSFVRKSKFRHVFAQLAKRENFYEGLHGTGTTLDTNMIKVNSKFISYIWEGSGGGAVSVFPITQIGRHPAKMPLISGHTRPVTDMDFSPFQQNLIATASEDCHVRIWNIPEAGLPPEGLTEPTVDVAGHGRKVAEVIWHPSASGILASAGADQVIKIWDVENKTAAITIEGQISDTIQSFQWTQDGVFIGTQSRDKKVRVFDVRTGTKVQEIQSHQGAKSARLVFNNTKNQIISTGFGVGSNRQILIWDRRNPAKPLVSNVVDQASGVMTPFLDEATQILFVSGRGEANIRYYELVDESPFMHYIATSQEGSPTRGITTLPKIYVNAPICEIMRFYRITAKDTIEPISFIVPRRSEMFQDDIFPPVVDSATASMTAPEWLAGGNKPQRQFVFTASGKPEYAAAGEAPPAAAAAPRVPSPEPSPVRGASATALAEERKKNEALQGKVTELQKRVEQLEQQRKEKDAIIAVKDETIGEKEAEIAEKAATIDGLRENRTALETLLAEKEAQIAELSKQVDK